MIEETHNRNVGKGSKPNYKGDGVAIWVNKTRDGKNYLSIKIVGHAPIYAFDNTEVD